ERRHGQSQGKDQFAGHDAFLSDLSVAWIARPPRLRSQGSTSGLGRRREGFRRGVVSSRLDRPADPATAWQPIRAEEEASPHAALYPSPMWLVACPTRISENLR